MGGGRGEAWRGAESRHSLIDSAEVGNRACRDLMADRHPLDGGWRGGGKEGLGSPPPPLRGMVLFDSLEDIKVTWSV